MSESLKNSGWREIKLGDFIQFKNGINADKSAYGKGVKFVNVMDVFTSDYLVEANVVGAVSVTDKQLKEYSVNYGDILFNRTSEVTNEIAYSSVYLDDKPMVFGGFVIRGRQKDSLLTPEYTKYCFKHSTIRKEFIRRSQGAIRSNIGQGDLSKVFIKIPSRAEQKVIAHILQTWDIAIEKTKALIATKAKRLEWLLYCMTQNSLKNSNSLKNLCKIKKGQQLNRSKLHSDGRFPAWNGGITPSGYTDKWNIEKNTITISEGGNSCGFVNYSKEKFWCGGHCYAIIVISSNINNEFLYYYLKSKQKNIMQLRVGSGLPNIQKKDIEKIQISYPDLEKQKNIAHVLNTAQSEINLLKQLLKKYQTQKRGLMQKLLSGEWRVRND